MKQKRRIVFAAGLLAMGAVCAQPPPVEIKATAISGSVHLLQGAGGNIGVSAGPDGVFLIDDQYAPMTENIRKALAKISDKPPRFVLNTHWHGDHTGGNEAFGNAGAVIVAHEAVRTRMSAEQFNKVFNRKTPAAPAAALPVVTFTDRVTFHLNGDEIHAFHVPPAHTDGDSLVHFRKADVVHTGDIFFNGFYPFIDVDSGGTVDGMIAAVDRALALGGSKTKIIPGHGPLASKTELQAYRDMLAAVRARVAALIESGKSLAEVQAARPTAAWDEKWGKGFLSPDQFVKIIFNSLSAEK